MHYAEEAQPKARGRSGKYRLILGIMIISLLVPAFMLLGFWQFNKYQSKTRLQQEHDYHAKQQAIAMPNRVIKASKLQYRHFFATGAYEAERQFLVDNRIHHGHGGYHVITPFRLGQSQTRLLVNRGWVPAAADRQAIPPYPPPAGKIRIEGAATVPPSTFFNLGATPPESGGRLWQNLDMKEFKEQVNYPLQSIVLRLSPQTPGGYRRDWPRPDERADKHLSYALQWFGFAAAAIGIWLFLWWGGRNR